MGEKYGIKEDRHIPGSVLHSYLNDFATHFDILRRIDFNTQVLDIEKLGQGWRLNTETTDSSSTVVYTCDKIIVCSGLASTPNPVNIRGIDEFERPVLNHSQLREEGARIAHDPNVETVTVVGASKTGYDVVHMMASNHKRVDWVIRESGGGGVWMSSPWAKFAGAKTKLELLATMRFFTWFSPCIFGDFDGFSWIRKVLHQTRLGRYFVHKFWEGIRMDIIDQNGYRKEECLQHLEPLERLGWAFSRSKYTCCVANVRKVYFGLHELEYLIIHLIFTTTFAPAKSRSYGKTSNTYLGPELSPLQMVPVFTQTR